MDIRQVIGNKKKYLPLLLLADEQEDMIDRYLERGDLYVLESDGEAVAVCVVTDEGEGIAEIKNLAVAKTCQHRGIGRMMLEFVSQRCRAGFHTLLVGTGDSPLTVPFYEKCGFVRSHSVPNFFTDNYNHPIFECGIQLVDMVYLQRPL